MSLKPFLGLSEELGRFSAKKAHFTMKEFFQG